MLYRLEGVSVSFAGREVLSGLSLQHNPGEKLIVVGRNGSGKTTLLRLINGDLEPDSGVVERSRGLVTTRLEQIETADPAIGVLDYCLAAFGDLLAVEREIAALQAGGGDDDATAARLHELHEALERLDGYRARPRTRAALEAVGLPPELHGRPLAELSGGQRTRAALVRALLTPGVTLLDEPTNHLDLPGVEFLAEELARPGRAFVLVTHDRSLVDRVGGAILELRGGRLERYPAGWARYRRERAARMERARRAWEQQQAEIRRQEEFIRRNLAGQNTRQAQARQNLLDRLERLPVPEAEPGPMRLRWPATGRSGDRVLEAEGLTVGWGREAVLRGVSFVLRRGERLAVVGRNGSGKSTLLRTLAGRLSPMAGGFRYGAGVVPGWFDQEQTELDASGSVLDVLQGARLDWSPAEVRAWAGRFAFSGEAAEATVTALSGGERARLALAALLAAGPNLLLLDEPTNHLDAATCEVLEEALAAFPGGVLLVSHDRRLVERVASGALLLGGGRVEAFERTEEPFERIGLVSSRRREGTGGGGMRRSAAEEERRRLRRDAAHARQKADRAGAELEAAEARHSELERRLCDREVFSDPQRAAALAAEAETLRERIDELVTAWSEAEEDATALEQRLEQMAGGG